MESILEQKKKGEINFRTKIDQFLIKSPYTKQTDQLTLPILQQLLSASNLEGVCNNGKINVEKLCQHVSQSEGLNNGKQLQRLLGRKQMKISELHQLLKNFELNQFDIEQQMAKLFFEGGSFSLQKMDSVMQGLGLSPLNSKDRQILVECFDYDRNKVITKSDVSQMMNCCIEGRARKQGKVQSIRSPSQENQA